MVLLDYSENYSSLENITLINWVRITPARL